MDHCDDCPVGQYQDHTRRSFCADCYPGSTTQSPLDANWSTTRIEGAQSIRDCSCTAGDFFEPISRMDDCRDNPRDGCCGGERGSVRSSCTGDDRRFCAAVKCPEGALCPGSYHSDGYPGQPYAAPGYYKRDKDDGKYLPCSPPAVGFAMITSSDRQTAHFHVPAKACAGNNTCSTGYRAGDLCALCDSGYFRRSGACVKVFNHGSRT
jgi:hypothetical protein